MMDAARETSPGTAAPANGGSAPANGGSLQGPSGEKIRAAQPHDLVSGKAVYYWSQSTNKYVLMSVNEPMGDDGYVNLHGKRHARLSNIYVLVQEEDDLPGLDGSSAAPPPLPALGADAEAPAEDAALAANGAGGAAANGASDPEDDDVDMCASSACYVTAVINWLRQLKVAAVHEKTTLAHQVHNGLSKIGSAEQIREAMKNVVPYMQRSGYVNMMTVPTKSRKGPVHVCFLAYNPESYPGRGMYLEDALTLLESTPMATLLSKVLEIRPKSGQTLNTFGWECDGAVINGAYSFIFTTLVAYAIINGVSNMPQPMARALGAIQTQYNKNIPTLSSVC